MIPRDSTSIIRHVFIQDSASTTGTGKTGLAYDTAGLSCYYIYPGGTATAITLENITTLGTYQAPTSNAHMRFKEVSATNMPGWYEIHLHNDWASETNNRRKINLCLKGATGMAPVNLSIDLIGFGIQNVAPYTTAYVVEDKTGYELTSGERSSIADALNASTVDGTLTELQVKRLVLAVLAGKAAVGTGSVAFKRADGTTTALTVEHDQNGNRTVITIGSV